MNDSKWRAIVQERISELENQKKAIDAELKQLASITGTTVSKAAPAAAKSDGKPRAKRGQRKEQFLEAVNKAAPEGITVAKIAKDIGAQAPGLYPLAKKLVEEGDVVKDGNLYRPAGSSPAKESKEAPAKEAKEKPPKEAEEK